VPRYGDHVRSRRAARGADHLRFLAEYGLQPPGRARRVAQGYTYRAFRQKYERRLP
jgi:hypothetical protein